MNYPSRHERKRSLCDTPVDLTKMQLALECLSSLKEELQGIEETEDEMDAVMEHVQVLEEILRGAKQPRISFSVVSWADLDKLGIERKRLVFANNKIDQRAKNIPKLLAELPQLKDRVQEIYEYVNMDYKPGSRMILDAILLSLARITSGGSVGVAILPEMRLSSSESSSDGVQVTNADSDNELWLTGSVDYVVIQYKDEDDNYERLLGPHCSRKDAFKISAGHLFIVEPKRLAEGNLLFYLPEAISQAIALAKLSSHETVRFCLSNGWTWIFCILRREGKKWVYYESAARVLQVDQLLFPLKLCRVITLVLEWLMPGAADLYQLKE